MEIKTIGVVGAGQMGAGIAQVAAQTGFRVILSDVAESYLQKGLSVISKNLERMVEKGKLNVQEKGRISEGIRGAIRLQEMAEADFVVEAVTENESVKLNLFGELDRLCRKEII